MQIKQLRSFLAVADTGSVTATAEQIHMTQSGISRQIANLEDELGFPLFDRVRGRLILNRRGIAFRRHVRKSVDSIDHLPRAARAIADGVFNRVSVVATSSIIHGLLPPTITSYVAQWPGLPPRIIMKSFRELSELSPEEDFDLVLAPMPIALSRFRLIDTIDFELRLAGPSENLPDGDEAIEISMLAGLPFVSLDPFATYQDSIETMLKEFDVKVSFVCETSSVVAAAQLVKLGVGYAFLDPFIAGLVDGPSVKVVSIHQKLMHKYGIYVPSNGSLSQESMQFLDTVRSYVKMVTGCPKNK